ncbi:helix-turn-helix domain-containing protein [Nocardioides zeae]|uniref:Helix-turn-helix domain-containing protein n=1 Tax=Nocardioides imazamoxiresistens TaxID=3231893 RepID=A0ABU3PSK5_9ACTN|nr:helix-turn-helix domain-containing protein [Nocardioides zeae]MDT9591765.1 helix-turn-helix domain-containing protein [Nocardioides zeae]
MTTPAEPFALPMADQPRVRSDAARNRDALLCTAARMVAEEGAQAVTMDRLAAEAGVGKGTIFRRFGNRCGVMTAVLDESEAHFQTSVMSGPPPLGPGAPAYERLRAFGVARLAATLQRIDLIEAAGGGRSHAAYTFGVLHVRHLLVELGVEGDLPLLAAALLAPLEVPLLRAQIEVQHLPVARLEAAWCDLADRVVGARDQARG